MSEAEAFDGAGRTPAFEHTEQSDRFSRVIYDGTPLPCIKPRGRGLFGDAVLTKDSIETTEAQAFETRAGPERRSWLCASTRAGVEVCTAHLASAEPE
jgi:endonuclease/exonuclease/phosphatase family metal-dependent hydrolase